MAVYTQSRVKLVPFFTLGTMMLLTLGGLGLYAAISSARQGQPVILVFLVSVFIISAGLFTSWVGAASFCKPMQVATSEEGLSVRYLTKERFWRWVDVSNIRIVRGSYNEAVGIYFDYTSFGVRKTARLPTCWTKSSEEMVTLLKSEKVRCAGT